MSKEFFGITFAAWQYWPAIIAILCFLGLVGYALRKRFNAVASLSDSHWRSMLFSSYSSARVWLKAFLYTIGLLFLYIALLRPQWGKKEQVVDQEGRDLLIALDVSRSMLAQDRKPNRLAFAKEKIKTLVNNLSSERVGLMLFSGSTIIQCPLTSDLSAFFMFLDQIDHHTISSGTTALDAAIKKAVDLFARSPGKKNKLFVMFTDGEDFSSNLALVRQQAAEQGLRIFTIGVGTAEGAPVPTLNDEGEIAGHQRDQKGNVVISRLNEGILRALAQESGGKYLVATDDNQDMRDLEKMIARFEKEKFDDKKIISLEERYPYFVAISFLCFLLEWVL